VGRSAISDTGERELVNLLFLACGVTGVREMGDTAVVRWPWEATHSGVSPSLGIPPTGKRVGIVGCSVFHFKNGKIVEQWEYSDMLGLLQQLGVIPALG
jgi:predicted ester cyclase